MRKGVKVGVPSKIFRLKIMFLAENIRLIYRNKNMNRMNWKPIH